MTLEDGSIIHNWLGRFSVVTKRAYRVDIMDFFAGARQQVRSVRTSHILDYLDTIGNGRSPAVQRRMVSAIKSFFQFVAEAGYRFDDPAAVVRNSQPEPPRWPPALSEQTVQDLILSTRTDREYMLVALPYYLALRGAEMTALIWDDVLDNRLRIRQPPTPRIVILPPHLVDRLVLLRGERLLSEPILLSQQGGGPITERSVDRILQTLATRAGLKAGGLHTLRNSHAQHALARGASLLDVQRSLGHTTTRAIQRHARIIRVTEHANTGAVLRLPQPATPATVSVKHDEPAVSPADGCGDRTGFPAVSA